MHAPASIPVTPILVADLLADGERLPVYVHVIGGRFENGVLVDSHSDRTPDVVWEMLGWVARRVNGGLKGVLIEWDEGFPSFEVLVEEAARAREVLACAV